MILKLTLSSYIETSTAAAAVSRTITIPTGSSTSQAQINEVDSFLDWANDSFGIDFSEALGILPPAPQSDSQSYAEVAR